jgi:hypothetical protein
VKRFYQALPAVWLTVLLATLTSSAQDRIKDERLPVLENPSELFKRPYVLAVAGAVSEDQEDGRSRASSQSMEALKRQGGFQVYAVDRKKKGALYRDSLAGKYDDAWQWKMDVARDDDGKWIFATYMAGVLPKAPKLPDSLVYATALFYTKTLAAKPEKLDQWLNGVLKKKGKEALFEEGAKGKVYLRYDFPFETVPVRKEIVVNKQYAKGKTKQITYEFSALKDSVVRVYAAFER